MTFAEQSARRSARFQPGATDRLVALGAIVAVPLLVAFFPRWAARFAMPLLAITSIGIYATVPDTERVSLAMGLMLVVMVVYAGLAIAPNQVVLAAAAFVEIGAVILDSGGRGAAIARATGCFGVLLAAPIAGWLNQLRTSGDLEWQPPITLLVAMHCLLVGWSSRALVRETSLAPVVVTSGGALAAAVLLLFAIARPVAVEP